MEALTNRMEAKLPGVPNGVPETAEETVAKLASPIHALKKWQSSAGRDSGNQARYIVQIGDMFDEE